MPVAASGVRAGAAFVELTAKDNTKSGLDSVAKKLKAWGRGITAVGEKILAGGLALRAPLVGAAQVFADMGSELADMSARTGVSVEALSELQYAATVAGTAVEDLEGGLGKMQKLIVEASRGSKDARETLGRLGLTLNDLASLSPDQQFRLLADRIAKVANPTVRAALAMDVFGKKGRELLPMISEGAAGLDRWAKEARDLGLVMSTEDAEAADAFGDSLAVLWKVLKMNVFVVGAALAPTLSEMVTILIRASKWTMDWITSNKDFIVTAFKITGVLIGVGAGLVGLGTVLTVAGSALGMISTVASALGSALAFLVSPIGLATVALSGLGIAIFTMTEIGADALSWLNDNFRALWTSITQVWQGIIDAVSSGDLGLAMEIAWLGVKVAWTRGILWLEEKWINFRSFFGQVFEQATTDLAMILNDSWAGMQSGWMDFTDSLADLWNNLVTGMRVIWNEFSGFVQKTWARIKSAFTGDDASAEIAAIQAAMDQANNQAVFDRDAKRQQIERDRQARAKAIEGDRAAIEQELQREQDRAFAEREAKKQEELKDARQGLEQAQKDLNDAIARAAAKRGALPDHELPGKRPLPNIPAIVEETKRKVEVAGTFNPFALGAIGPSSVAERAAKATEEVAANTKELLKEVKRGGTLVFK